MDHGRAGYLGGNSRRVVRRVSPLERVGILLLIAALVFIAFRYFKTLKKGTGRESHPNVFWSLPADHYFSNWRLPRRA